MVLAKYPAMVKLEKSLVYNSKVLERGQLCVPSFVRVLGFYISVGPKSMPWSRSSFLIGENLFNPCIFWNPFLIGVFLIRGKRGAQDISLYTYVWRPSKVTSGSSTSPITSSGLSASPTPSLGSSGLPTTSSGSLASPTPSSGSSASPTSSSGLSEIHISPLAYSLQLTVFSLLSSAYCAQDAVVRWSCRLYNKVVSHEWRWQPCYVCRLLFHHGLITKLPLSAAPYSIASLALADGLWS